MHTIQSTSISEAQLTYPKETNSDTMAFPIPFVPKIHETTNIKKMKFCKRNDQKYKYICKYIIPPVTMAVD